MEMGHATRSRRTLPCWFCGMDSLWHVAAAHLRRSNTTERYARARVACGSGCDTSRSRQLSEDWRVANSMGKISAA